MLELIRELRWAFPGTKWKYFADRKRTVLIDSGGISLYDNMKDTLPPKFWPYFRIDTEIYIDEKNTESLLEFFQREVLLPESKESPIEVPIKGKLEMDSGSDGHDDIDNRVLKNFYNTRSDEPETYGCFGCI